MGAVDELVGAGLQQTLDEASTCVDVCKGAIRALPNAGPVDIFGEVILIHSAVAQADAAGEVSVVGRVGGASAHAGPGRVIGVVVGRTAYHAFLIVADGCVAEGAEGALGDAGRGGGITVGSVGAGAVYEAGSGSVVGEVGERAAAYLHADA